MSLTIVLFVITGASAGADVVDREQLQSVTVILHRSVKTQWEDPSRWDHSYAKQELEHTFKGAL